MKLVNWSSKKLEPNQNQSSPSQLCRPEDGQESSVGGSRSDQDRSGEQLPEPDKSSTVPAVTCSSSEQLHLPPGTISLPSSPSGENLDFAPPTNPFISPNCGRLSFPDQSPNSPPVSPGWSRLFGENSGGGAAQQPSLSNTPFATPSTSPTNRTLPVIVLNPFPPSRPHSAPTSPTLSRSVLPRFPVQQQRNLSIPIEQAFPKLTTRFVPTLGISGRLSGSRSLSLSWDNYSSDPSFAQKHRTIPVLSSSSDSLESSPTTFPEITIHHHTCPIYSSFN